MEQIIEQIDNQKAELAKALKRELHKRAVKFKYTKKDGAERDAYGTLNINIMGKENEPSGTGREFPDSQIRYYDLNSNGWRSFLVENLISYE